MSAQKFVMVKLKTTPFAGSFVVGELVGKDKGMLKLRNTAQIHYLISQEQEGTITVRPTFLVNWVESEGTWELSEYEVLAWRYLDKSEEAMKGYEAQMSRFRVEKAGLAIPPAQPEQASPLV